MREAAPFVVESCWEIIYGGVGAKLNSKSLPADTYILEFFQKTIASKRLFLSGPTGKKRRPRQEQLKIGFVGASNGEVGGDYWARLSPPRYISEELIIIVDGGRPVFLASEFRTIRLLNLKSARGGERGRERKTMWRGMLRGMSCRRLRNRGICCSEVWNLLFYAVGNMFQFLGFHRKGYWEMQIKIYSV